MVSFLKPAGPYFPPYVLSSFATAQNKAKFREKQKSTLKMVSKYFNARSEANYRQLHFHRNLERETTDRYPCLEMMYNTVAEVL